MFCDKCGTLMKCYRHEDSNHIDYSCPQCGSVSYDVDLSRLGNSRTSKTKVKEMPKITYTTTKRLPRGKKNREAFLSHVRPKMALHLMDVGEAEGLTAEEFTLILADMLQDLFVTLCSLVFRLRLTPDSLV